MAGNVWEQLNEEQLRKIISSYLDEVAHYYKEQQRVLIEGSARGPDQLEQKASQLLAALAAPVDPGERRKAVLQVLCQAMKHRELNFPS